MNKRQLGSKYEDEAVEYLKDNGYRIRNRNFRTRYGEIDIIAEKDNVIVYAEVKYRGSCLYGNPVEAVDVRKQRQISRVALLHYSKFGCEGKACRFDVIGIDNKGSLTHIKNAFDFIY